MKLLQINVTSNWGSTGKIAEQIGKLVMAKGWESYIAYGRYCNPSESKLIKIGSQFDVYEHYFENKALDNEGLASRRATSKLIGQIKQIKPDLIHLHNIHDHYLNYPILFKYLSTLDIPVVWTQHDCWAFTGGCGYYSMAGCDQWLTECHKCPIRRSSLFDRSFKQYNLKKQLFKSVKNLTLVPVSEWLAGEVSKSFFRDIPSVTILNGIDVNTFIPKGSEIYVRKKYGIGESKYYLAVAAVWAERKALPDYIKLASYLKDDEKIVLVGLTEAQSKNLPANVLAIPRTQNVNELVALYNEASVVLNLSYEETFGLTTAEGLACGTPSIVYNCTASPELITPETGRAVKAGDIEGVFQAICELNAIGKEHMSEACRNRAVEKYNKDKCFKEYVRLYEEVMRG